MRIKTSIVVGLTIILISSVSIFLIPALQAQGSQKFVETEIPVVIKQLKTSDGSVPVGAQCEKVIISKPDTLDTYSCILVNNSNNSILAASYILTIINEHNGVEEKYSRVETFDTFINSEFSPLSHPIMPGGTIKLQAPGQTSIPGTVIKRLEIGIDYVEFADKSILGVPGEGAKRIDGIRAGAQKYKNWLKKEYLKRGKSTKNLVPLLDEDTGIPEEIEFNNKDERLGASIYRRRISNTYKEKGLPFLSDFLNK
jgi:hypothetical protein